MYTKKLLLAKAENNNRKLDQEKHTEKVEIWGGAEYSVVRLGNSVYDQLSRTGFETGTEDLNYIYDLGIRKIRYPLLWEKYSGNEEEFFRIHDTRLKTIQDLGMTPIAGLLHHGSGPFNTSLYDPGFPSLLAEYAEKIAERYPWIQFYTPVNEPLTTARFSGLYGIWYPHLNDGRSFVRIFLNELKGIVLSMKAIRNINPSARLIQTEDICRIYSTGTLRYQADFENQRRWLTYDFLLGKVDKNHPMRKYFTDLGIEEQELDFFSENPEIPAICGFNYYVTSERFLDQRKSVYPERFHGGNGLHDYADVEAVRANIPQKIGSYELLREAWERYKIPVALTEVHLACTREDQLRWFHEAWKNATALRSEGVDIVAITAWSLFGSFDWSSLLCVKNNDYEPGVYDIRSGEPRPTALAGLIRSLINNDKIQSPLISLPGWWKRRDRVIYKPEQEPSYITADPLNDILDAQPLLILGASGSLGNALARLCRQRGIAFHLSGRREIDIASEQSVNNLIEEIKPWAIINAAGFTRIDEAEKAAYACFRENTIGPVMLAEACRKAGVRFVTISADQVFNGEKKKPYREDDHTNPLNLYGFSKKIAEEKVLKINPDSLIIRSGSFFNPWHKNDNLARILSSDMPPDNHFYLPSDIIISPSYIPDLGNIILDLLIDGETGIWHLSSQEEISNYDFTRMALNMAGLDESIIIPVPSSRLKYAAVRPSYSVLKSSSGIVLPLLVNALKSFIDEFQKEHTQVINQSSLII